MIYGLGRSGRGAARFLGREGIQAEWMDARPAQADLELMAELGFRQGQVPGQYDVVVAAPGVPIDHPDLNVLRAAGAEVIGEVVLAARRRPHLPMIGITGTAGKGGTTVLTAHLLRACGVNALEGGNIDPPLLDVVDSAEVAVVELSSFQLERVPGLRLPVAVVTNLGVDHLDRHGSVKAYHAAKLNITAGQQGDDVLVFPEGLAVQTQASVRHFSEKHIQLQGGTQVLELSELPEGIHPANAAAAVLAAQAMLEHLGRPVNAQVLADGLRSARPVAGRFETVAQLGEVRFIEDSIATRTIAVKAALERARPPIAWLVGGRDKGAELAPLIEAARGRVVKVIAFGEDGVNLATRLGLPFEGVQGNEANDPTAVTPTFADPSAANTLADDIMRRAVQAGFRALPGHGTVLLAPIGTSFDLFRDYKERGASFRRASLDLTRQQQEDSMKAEQA